MKKFAIIGDSTCDLTTELRKKYDIDYCLMGVVVDGKELKADLDWKEYSADDLYGWMIEGKKVKTTQVSVEEFESKFTKHLDAGEDILYISCSSGLSGSVNTAEMVKTALLENPKYKDAKIICVDSLNSCLGQGSMLIKASELRAEGKTLEETAKWIEDNKLRFNQFCTIDSLKYLKNAGRVKATTAFFGDIIGVKPIFVSDVNGANNVIEKQKGKKNAMNRIVELAKDTIGDNKDQTVYILTANAPEDAEYLRQKVAEEIGPKDIHVSTLGPIIGCSCGPKTVVIYCYGKECLVGRQ
jgi:DegV family protein with EDD domain